jgi:Subtilase family
MPERPLLVLSPPDVHDTRLKAGGGGGSSLRLPDRARQRDRLEHRLAALQEQFAKRAVELRTSPTGVEPEEVIVLEIAGEVADFARAVLRIEGLEWLAEIAGDEVDPDDDFFEVDKRDQKKQRPLGGRLFMVFSNQTALAQILGLWKSWQEGQELPRGFAPWRQVFERLRDVRRWSAADRIAETGLLAEWRERLGLGGPVRCEIELWHRQSEARRQAARERIEALLAHVGGRVVMRCYVPEIAYDALVGEVSRPAVESLLADTGAAEDIELLRCEDIQHVWPVGQMSVGGALADEGLELVAAQVTDLGPPVSALFDGLPLQNHQALQDRLVVDDPDGFEESYSARQRVHGTSMASIMIHGDLAAAAAPLARRIYVRPILKPHPWAANVGEIVPEDQLIVDLVHRAVQRMKVGDATQPAAAPHVCVVNLSIGDRSRPFHAALSPLARLLDWLSWRHQILFLVSSGNHLEPIRLPISRDTFLSLSPEDQRSIILRTVAEGLRVRRLLSPSEAVNALTVGAMHTDASASDLPPGHLDPFGCTTLPSPVSCLAPLC